MADQPLWIVNVALRDAALHDLRSVLGADQAHRLYRNDVGFHAAVDALVAAGWWPTSQDQDERAEERYALAAVIEAAVTTPVDLRAVEGLAEIERVRDAQQRIIDERIRRAQGLGQ